MAASPRETREAKRRIQQMEAKRELRRDQEKRRKRDNLIAGSAGAAAVVLAVVLQLTVFAGNPTEEEFAAAEAGLASSSATPSASATHVRFRARVGHAAGALLSVANFLSVPFLRDR